MAAPRPVVHVVDDDASYLKAIARLLRAAGFEVATYDAAERLNELKIRYGRISPRRGQRVAASIAAARTLRARPDAGLARGADAAEEGARATIPLVARKGRASYLGERSAGHQDPGATSSAHLVRCAARAWAA